MLGYPCGPLIYALVITPSGFVAAKLQTELVQFPATLIKSYILFSPFELYIPNGCHSKYEIEGMQI